MSAIVRRPPCAETGSLRSVPPVCSVSESPADLVHPIEPRASIVGSTPGSVPPSARELAERAVRNAEAGCAKPSIAFPSRAAASAKPTALAPRAASTAVTASRSFAAERIRERKAAAFRFLNSRQMLVRDALRRIAEARATPASLAASWGREP